MEKNNGAEFNRIFSRFLKSNSYYKQFFSYLEKTYEHYGLKDDSKEESFKDLLKLSRQFKYIESFNPFGLIDWSFKRAENEDLLNMEKKWKSERMKVGFIKYNDFINDAIKNETLFTSSKFPIVIRFKQINFRDDWHTYYLNADVLSEKLTFTKGKTIYLEYGISTQVYKSVKFCDFLDSLIPITKEEAIDIAEKNANNIKNSIEERKKESVESMFEVCV